MKKLVLKTALITLGVALLLGMAIFGIVSLAAPAAMMEFTASMGLESLSGDYAWEEYGRSGNVDCLVRSFLIAAEHGSDRSASERFDVLFAREDFDEYCASVTLSEGAPDYDFRDYVVGWGMRVKYRLASHAEEREAIVENAASETKSAFPAYNPLFALSLEVASAQDAATAEIILNKLSEGPFEETLDYLSIVKILESIAHA